MVEKQSWNGTLEKQYRDLGFIGGYPRKRNRDLPSSMANSEYVKSDGISNYVVAIAGKEIPPRKDMINSHYNHAYGNTKSAKQQYARIKLQYVRKLKQLNKRQ